MTRSTKLGFTQDVNTALVSLSRAKQLMIVLANKDLFDDEKASPLWSSILKNAKELNSYAVSNDQQPVIMISV
jgi:hypothetical protein